jgi:hypothetical protein
VLLSVDVQCGHFDLFGLWLIHTKFLRRIGSRGGVDPTTATDNFDSAVAEHGYAAVARGLCEGMFFDNPPSWKDETVAHAAAQRNPSENRYSVR